MAVDYPKKYWWLILVGVPIIIAIIQIYPDITVEPPTPPRALIISEFLATPTKVNSGEPSKLSWVTANAVRVTLDGKTVANIGSEFVRPYANTTYTLRAYNEKNEQVSDTLVVDIISRLPVNSGTLKTPRQSVGDKFIASLNPSKYLNDKRVKEAIKIAIDGNDFSRAKMLMAEAGLRGGVVLALNLSAFEKHGGSVKDVVIVAKRLERIGVRFDQYR